VGGGGPRGTAEERPAEGPGSASTAESGAEAVDAALETRSIPSLDPNRTADTADVQANPGPGAGARDAEPAAPEPRQEPDGAAGTDRAGTAEPATGEAAGSANAGGGAQARADETAELREELERREAEIDRLEEELAAADREREGLEADLAELREERDDLRAEVERLEEELERLREEFGAAGEADRRLTPAEALDGTDLFVRYRSKGDATLEKAHDGEGRKSEVTDNLRLEKHTQFDAESAAVGGQAYDAFLEERIEYGFVRWVVEDLLFEIRDTGHAEALADLYDALPKVDRAELDGAIAVTYTEDGQEQRGQESFDIVLRDRMGNPLLVANLNDSREAATEGMMEGLITAAERVGQSKDTFVGAFLVTRSFFEPEALETASEATKSGLLSRDKRQSFVNLSRKRGYHLCLVEARNQNFHLAVPEL
jgi:regulator of replication initiation timing